MQEYAKKNYRHFVRESAKPCQRPYGTCHVNFVGSPKRAGKKKLLFRYGLGPPPPPPRAVSGHSDFMQVFFTCINIYVFDTRKA